MTRKRWIGLAGAVAAVFVALLVLRGHGGGKKQQTGVAANAKGPSLGRTQAAKRAARVDPHTAEHVRISGRVTSDDGTPIEGARVCSEVHSPDLAQVATRAPRCTKTDADGNYALTKLLPATHLLGASAPEHTPKRFRDKDGRRWIQLRAGEERRGADFVLRGGGVLARGIVKDIGGGPVVAAQVRISGSWRSRHGPSFGVTDAKGAFAVWTAPGPISVDASAEGYATGSADGRVPGQHIEVLLTPESVLAGRVVVTGTDKPVANAKVQLHGRANWNGQRDVNAFTDADGRFRIAGIRPGRFKPTATAAGFYGQSKDSVLLGLGQTRDDVIIEVHRALVVTGVVRTPDNQPCDSGGVSLTDKEQALDYSGGTDRDGSVTIKAVLPGTYSVRAYCKDYVNNEDAPNVVVTDADISGLVWTVGKGVSVVGRVLDGAGKPVESAWVRIRTAGGAARGKRSWASDTTLRDGRFELEGLLPGSFQIRFGADGFVSPKDPTDVTVQVGETKEVELALSRGGTIEGKVVDQAGAAVPKVFVRAVGKRWGGGGGSVSTADDGTFTIKGVRSGSYRVVAQRSWRTRLRSPGSSDDDVQGKRVEVRNDATVTVELVVENQSGTIEGRVVDELGKPVADAFVSGQRESDAKGASRARSRRSVRWTWQDKPVLTDTDGRFRLVNLSDGKYTVRAFRRGGGEAFAESVAVGSKDATLTILATGSISGTVRLDDGSAPDRFSISIRDRVAGFRRSEQFFRTGGAFSMRDLPAGSFSVGVSAPAGTARQKVELTTGQAMDGVALVLASRATVTGRVVSLEDGNPVAGIYVSVRPLKGGDAMTTRRDKQRQYISDAQGRFTITKAPAGRVRISCFPMNYEKSPYTYASKILTVKAGGTRDVGDVAIPKRRTKPRERGGDLGFKLSDNPPDTEPEDTKRVVSFIRPGGPAQHSGLRTGDEIVSIDGHDVRGANGYLYWALTSVSEGTTIALGLTRGATVKITAAKPL